MTSGRPPFQGTTSTEPPASRILLRDPVRPRRSTSAACSGSALTDGIAISSASWSRSSSCVGATGASVVRSGSADRRTGTRCGLEAVGRVERDAEVARPERVAAAAALRPEPLDLAERVHREAARAVEPALVAGARERLQERVAVPRRAVTDRRALLERRAGPCRHVSSAPASRRLLVEVVGRRR